MPRDVSELSIPDIAGRVRALARDPAAREILVALYCTFLEERWRVLAEPPVLSDTDPRVFESHDVETQAALLVLLHDGFWRSEPMAENRPRPIAQEIIDAGGPMGERAEALMGPLGTLRFSEERYRDALASVEGEADRWKSSDSESERSGERHAIAQVGQWWKDTPDGLNSATIAGFQPKAPQQMAGLLRELAKVFGRPTSQYLGDPTRARLRAARSRVAEWESELEASGSCLETISERPTAMRGGTRAGCTRS